MFYLPDSFLVEIGEIDDQHLELVDLANEMGKLLGTGQLSDFEPLFERFMSMMRSHFSYEETLMQNADYPYLEWHTQHHRDVETRTLDLVEKCREEGIVTREAVVESFTNILSDVVHADLSFAEFTRTKNAALKPPALEGPPPHS